MKNKKYFVLLDYGRMESWIKTVLEDGMWTYQEIESQGTIIMETYDRGEAERKCKEIRDEIRPHQKASRIQY